MYFDPYVFGGMATGLGGMMDQMSRSTNRNREIEQQIEATNRKIKEMVREYEKLYDAYKELQSVNETLMKDKKTTNTHENYKIINNCDDWISLGNEYFKQKKLDNAINAYNKAIKINSQNPIAWYNLGKVLDFVNENEDAVQAYSNAFEILDKYYFDSWNEKRIALQRLKKYPQLNLDYDIIIEKLAVEYKKALMGKGYALTKVDRYEEALYAYEKALLIDPDNDSTWSNIGDILHELAKYEEAIAAYDKAIKIMEKDNVEIYELGWNLLHKSNSLKKLGRYEDAIETCNKAFELDNEWWAPLEHIADIEFAMGRYEDALITYDKSLEICDDSANHPPIQIKKGKTYAALNKSCEAINQFDEVIQDIQNMENKWYFSNFLENYIDALYCKSLSLKKIGNNMEAAQALAKINELKSKYKNK